MSPKMRPMVGIEAPNLSLKLDRHIEYFEGPLIAILKGADNDTPYMTIWRDRDSVGDRWLTFEVTGELIAAYMEKAMSLLVLMQNAVGGRLYLQEWNAAREETTYLLEFVNLPPEYVPEADSYYDEDLAP